MHVAHVHAADLLLVDLVLREAAGELLEADPPFEPGQRGAEAEVEPVPEAERDVRRAVDVETASSHREG